MRALAPAVCVAGLLLLLSPTLELARLLWTHEVMVGVVGGPLLHHLGPGATGDGWGVWIALTAVANGLLLVGAGLACRARGAEVVAPLVLVAGGLAAVGWAGLATGLGLGSLLDAALHPPVLFLAYAPPAPWALWGRWLADAGALGALALLLGFGPRSPTARRAVLASMLALATDNAWRVAVTLASGASPALFDGLGPLEPALEAFAAALALLGVVFVGLTASLPGAEGPRRGNLLGLTALAGLALGLQAGALYGLGLLLALGVEAWIELPLPTYPGLLAALRVGLGAAVGAAVLLGLRREPPPITVVHDPDR